MSKEQKVVYEPHPVSPERKAALRSQGYRIIDARFAPEVHQTDSGKVSEAEERAALIAELTELGIEFDDTVNTDELRALSITPQGAGSLTVPALRAALTERGIVFDPKAKKPELQALLDAAG